MVEIYTKIDNSADNTKLKQLQQEKLKEIDKINGEKLP